MATAWVRSLSCRSYGVADAVVAPSPTKKTHPPTPTLRSVSCGAAADVRDSVAFMRLAQKQKPRRERRRSTEQQERRHEPKPSRPKKKPKQMAFMPSPAAPPPSTSSAFLTMAELPEGHSSRQVVELIFSSGWTAAAAPRPEVEALFRVHSAAREVARFEEARAAARAHGAAARCGADGNEMMRFQCRPAAGAGGGGVFGAGVATCSLGPAGSAVRTFDCSGAAHSSAGGGAGRRAMLVCRVIAGRVRPAHDQARRSASDYDSVDMGSGELIVLDSRAVLPCFLVIYKV